MVARILWLSAMWLCAVGGIAHAQGPAPLVLLDGDPVALESPAILEDGHLLVWVRDLARIAGGQVYLRSTDGAAVIRRDRAWTAFSPGRAEAEAPGRTISLPVSVTLVDGKIMVPLEAGCRALGIGCAVERRMVATISRIGGLPSRGAPRLGSISGRVVFADKGKAGVHLRLVRAGDFTFIPGARAITGVDGEYQFRDLAPGIYHVYAYFGDNPRYFNRHTDFARVRGNAVAVTMDDLELGMVLQPLEPQPDAVIEPGEEVVIRWSDAPGATEYELTITDDASGEDVFSTRVSEPLATVPGSRLGGGRAYRWRVSATGRDGAFLGGTPGAGSQPWTFSVR